MKYYCSDRRTELLKVDRQLFVDLIAKVWVGRKERSKAPNGVNGWFRGLNRFKLAHF